MVVIHREPVFEKYDSYGDWCSCFVYLLFLIISVVVTFLLAFYSENFWITHNEFIEQPKATFRQEIILTYENQHGDTKLWTSNAKVNSLVPTDSFFFPTFVLEDFHDLGWRKNWEFAYNFATPSPTANADMFRFTFSIPIESTESIYKVNMLLFFTQEITNRQNLIFDNVLHISHGAALSGRSFTINGDLVISQRRPFFLFMPMDYFAGPLFELGNVTTLEELSFYEILEMYKNREVHSKFTKNFKLWETGKTDVFKCVVEVNIPHQTFAYTPWIWEILKLSWMQFLAIFILVFLVLYYVKRFFVVNDYLNTKLIKIVQKKKKVKFL